MAASVYAGSGTTTPPSPYVTGGGICTTDAVRSSVCRSEGGATGIRGTGTVKSVTKGLRLAYGNVECNI